MTAHSEATTYITYISKGVRTRVFRLIIYLPCFDHCVFFVVLFSVLFRLRLMCTTERGRSNRCQLVRIEVPCISVSYCAFAQERFQTAKYGLLEPLTFNFLGIYNTRLYKKLVYKKLVLRWPKSLVLCLSSIKKLLKAKS